MQPNIWIVIFTSAVVSTFISGLFTIGNDWLRRKSEEKRFKLEVALKLTDMKQEQKKLLFDANIKTGGDFKEYLAHPLTNFVYHLWHIERLWKEDVLKREKPPTGSDMEPLKL